MADITMCMNELCPSAGKCRRSARSGTPFSDRQCVQDFKRGSKAEKCVDFWHTNEYSENKDGSR